MNRFTKRDLGPFALLTSILCYAALALGMVIGLQGLLLQPAHAAPSKDEAACMAAYQKSKAESQKTYEAEFAEIGKRAAADMRIIELRGNLNDLRGTGRTSLIRSLRDELKSRLHLYDVEKGEALKRAIARNNQAKKAYDACMGRVRKKPAVVHKQPKKRTPPAAASGGGTASGAVAPSAENFVAPKVAKACKPLAQRLTGLRFELASIRYEKKTLGSLAEGIRDESAVQAEIKKAQRKLDACVQREQKKQPGGSGVRPGVQRPSGGGAGGGGAGSGSGAQSPSGGGAGSGSGSMSPSGSSSGSGSGATSPGPLFENMRGKKAYSVTAYAPDRRKKVVVDEDAAYPVHFLFRDWACGGDLVSFFTRARQFIDDAMSKPLPALNRIAGALRSGGNSFAVGGDPFDDAQAFMQAIGAPARFKIWPAMTVSAPGRKTIRNCYTAREVAAMVKDLKDAVGAALASHRKMPKIGF